MNQSFSLRQLFNLEYLSESKGWNAANEMPSMATMLQQMQTMGLMEGRVVLEHRSRVAGGQTKHFVLPRLAMDTSPMEILSGEAKVGSLQQAVAAPELEAAATVIVDAEIVQDVKGWDTPPAGVSVKKNPDPPPKFIPA